ncbi:MAG: hypothetical protein WCS69_10515 [Ignavibacteriaceae bacterium]|jgi:photosystem II stability/assembly factor-like uncharacterized protein
MKKIFDKIIFTLTFLSVFIFYTCKESNPTEIKNNSQEDINTWANVTNGLPLGAYRIASIGSKIYVFVNYKLYSSTNDGESWKNIGIGLPDSAWVGDITGYNNFMAITTEGKGVFISSDFGETWIKPTSSGLGLEYIHSITMDSTFLYIGVGDDAEIYRSSDLGNSWTSFKNGFPITTSVYYPRIELLIKNNNKLFACPFFSGIYSSNDNGNNWQSMNDGLSDHSSLWSFAVSDSFYFATEESNVEQGLYRYNFYSSTWVKISNITDYMRHFVVAHGSTVVASIDSVIKISFDNGNTWNLCNKGLDDATYSLFYYAVVHDNYVFAANNYRGIWRYLLK